MPTGIHNGHTRTPVPIRFWSKVDRPEDDACWLWTGAKDAAGYGSFGVRLSDGSLRSRGAHRVAYELLVGPIPDGLTIDHLCRVRHCVNPAHLEPVTFEENCSRQVSANKSKTHCPLGHPLSGDNLKPRPNGRRGCRECQRAANVRWRARVKAQLEAKS